MYKNYRPLLLLPIFVKILEKLTFEELFQIFMENKLIAANQSGAKPGDFALTSL